MVVLCENFVLAGKAVNDTDGDLKGVAGKLRGGGSEVHPTKDLSARLPADVRLSGHEKGAGPRGILEVGLELRSRS